MPEPVTAKQVESLRKQLAFLARDGDRYRAVITDSESADGITLVCTSPRHIENDTRSEWSAPPPEDGTGVSVYDCCLEDMRPIETHSETFAAFVVAAIDAVPALLDEVDALRDQSDYKRFVAAVAEAAGVQFFQAGRTYRQRYPFRAPEGIYEFRCEAVAEHPAPQPPDIRAFGFQRSLRPGDAWKTCCYASDAWNAHEWTEVDETADAL